MIGATWNINPVVVLKTLPFLNSKATSLTGCKIPGPFRPDAILLARNIIPGKKKPVINMRIKPVIIR
jgi:hypothetical protein